jgi:hypothetical protein
MKMYLKQMVIWIALSLGMCILWIVGMMIGNAIFPSSLMDAAGESQSGMQWLLLICLLNTGVIMIFIFNSQVNGWRLVKLLFLITFGIQFFMSQIETVWFNDALKMPVNSILAVVTGGALMSMAFAIAAVWAMGKFNETSGPQVVVNKPEAKSLITRILLLAVFIWPMVYFLAGYFIAWQFDDIRQYYTGTTAMDGFFVMMQENFRSGLFLFQVIRGFLWVVIALIVLYPLNGSMPRRAIILGLLLSLLGGSQLILPNPIMPEMVRTGHLLEITISNFVWGLLLGWFLDKFFSKTPVTTKSEAIATQPVTSL